MIKQYIQVMRIKKMITIEDIDACSSPNYYYKKYIKTIEVNEENLSVDIAE